MRQRGRARRCAARHLERQGGWAVERLEPRRLLSTVDVVGGGSGVVEQALVGELTHLGGAIVFAAGRSVLTFDPISGASGVVKTFWGAGEYRRVGGEPGGFTSKIQPDDFTVVGSNLYFTADDGVHGRELWRTDGTPAGTALVKDIHPGPASSAPHDLKAFNGRLYFGAYDKAGGDELWSTDGTAAETKRVADLGTGAAGIAPRALTVAHGKLYFLGGVFDASGNGTVTLFSTDSAGKTIKVMDPGGAVDLLPAGEDLYLLDGSTQGQVSGRVRRISPGGQLATLHDAGEDPFGLNRPVGVAFGGKLYFAAADGKHGQELRVTDGTVGGTVLVKDLARGSNPAGISGLVATDRALFFRTDYGNQFTLWTSDGTAAGTVPVEGWSLSVRAEIEAAPRDLLPVGSKLYYSTENAGLWVTDGTAAGTRQVDTFNDFGAGPSSRLVMDSRSFYVGTRSSITGATGLRRYKDGRPTEFRVTRPDVILTAPPLVAAGQKNYELEATFTSRLGVALFGMHGYEFDTQTYVQAPLFRVTGPGGFVADASYVAVDRVAAGPAGQGGAIRTATWSVRGPGGTWDPADAGLYTVTVRGIVEDIDGNRMEERVVGTFRVDPPVASVVTLAGAVFEDFDRDGTRDATERGLGGYEVFIDSTPNSRYDAGEPLAVTDRKGRYAFTGLVAGGYRLRLRDPRGRADTTGVLPVTARPGTTAYASFGVADAGFITGSVFDDVNASAARDGGDLPAKGAIVWADLDADDQPDSFEPATRADAKGNYALVVPAGRHAVRTGVPAGRRVTLAAPAALDVAAGATGSATLGTTDKAFVTGTVFYDRNADGAVADDGGMSAQVYADLNGNGTLDAGEPSARSRPTGKFRLDNLAAGRYRIRVNPPDGSWSVTAGSGYLVRLPAAGSVKRTFALSKAAELRGVVFNDTNGSHHKDDFEPGIAGRTVFADANGNGVLDAGEPSTNTGADGAYRLAVRPGEHHLVLQPTAGWRMTRGRSTITVQAVSGQATVTDFANTDKAVLTGNFFVDGNGDHRFSIPDDYPASGTVYLDANGNGIRDAGEPATGGYFGPYSFIVAPGTYFVRVDGTDGKSLVGPKSGYLITVGGAEARGDLNFEVV